MFYNFVLQDQPPLQKYALQLQQLSMMGFSNRDANCEG